MGRNDIDRYNSVSVSPASDYRCATEWHGGVHMRGSRRRHRVMAVIYDRLALFELAIAVEVFGLSRPELDIPWYEFGVFSLDPGSLRATGAVRIAATSSLTAIGRAD